MRSLFAILVPLLIAPSYSLSQYLGGTLSYSHIGGHTYQLEASLYLPTDSSAPDTLAIHPGTSYPVKAPLSDSSLLCDSLQEFFYAKEHTFPGSGTYSLSLADSSFSRPFINTPGIDSAYRLLTTLIISPFSSGPNIPVSFEEKPLKKVHPNDSLIYHPAFTNPDGDSLHFELVSPDSSPAYSIPQGITVNQKSGELRWMTPDTNGRYSFTMEVSEYGTGGSLKGRTQHQFTIDVRDTVSEQASFQEISGFQTNSQGYSEVHVPAGQDLNLVLRYSDPQADSVSLDAIGEPFSQTPSPFYFSSDSGTSGNASFSWTPDNSHIREHPYILTFIGRSHAKCSDHYKPVMIYVEEASSLKGADRKGNELSLYPQPANSILHLRSGEPFGKSPARIIDRRGRVLKKFSVKGAAHKISLNGLPSGAYFLLIEGPERKVRKSFIIN